MKLFKICLWILVIENIYFSIVLIDYFTKFPFEYFDIQILKMLWLILSPFSFIIFSLQLWIAVKNHVFKNSTPALKYITVINYFLLFIYTILALKIIYEFIDVK